MRACNESHGLALSVARSERNAKATAYEQADANFRQARDAVDQFLTEVGDSPDLKTCGLDPLRRQLLAKAKQFYENFAREHADSTSLQADLALAYYRLAEIENRMGNLAAAEKLYDQALDRYADLEQAEPGNPDHRSRQGYVLNDVALVYKATNRRQETESTWQRRQAASSFVRIPRESDYASRGGDTNQPGPFAPRGTDSTWR
jgi:tetratricopeptide (TPR) repeat protein